jgi:hypothetical protein
MRTTILALVLANAGYFAWSQGHLTGLGDVGGWADPQPKRAPQRLDNQLQPERLTPLKTDTAGTRAADSPTPDTPKERGGDAVCLQASGLSDAQANALREGLSSALPERSWDIETTAQPARWVVYLGKFPSLEALRARKAELRAAKVEHRDVGNPTLQPGLALGTFSTEAAAAQAQRDLARGGIKNTKVVTERPETRLHVLSLPQATVAIQNTLRSVIAERAGDLAGLELQPCAD